MIQIYFESGKIPVRYPLYICMFNLARIISFESLDSADALNHSIAILMVGLALLALAGRKYIRDREISMPKISDLSRKITSSEGVKNSEAVLNDSMVARN